MAENREISRRELALKELQRRGISLDKIRQQSNPNQSPSMNMSISDLLKNDVLQGAQRLNKGVENYVVAPALGFMQGAVNTGIGLGNIAKHGLEDLGSTRFDKKMFGENRKAPDLPYFDVAPHTYPAQAGEAALLAMGGRGPAEFMAKGAKKGWETAKKGWEYLSPKGIAQETEKFRQGVADVGSESENIGNLSKRVQFAKKSGTEEALIPKREIYSQEGKTNVYGINPKNLPEGNLPKIAHMIEPGAEFGETQAKALSKALKEFRAGKKDSQGNWEIKPGDTSHFLERSEELFGVENLPKGAESKIEDALLLPTKRNSAYLSESDVISPYAKKGELKKIHDAYAAKPTLNNYDALQSQLKREERKLKKRDKAGTLGDVGQAKLEQLQTNIANLDEDATAFFKTLPENMQNLEKKFRTLYAKGPGKYKDAELTLKRLASGKPGVLTKVTDEDIINTFTKPDEATLAAMQEMGPSVGRNIIYSALNKIKPGKGKEIAETLIDLSRKPGFENWITEDMINWSNQMLKRQKHSNIAKKAAYGIGGASALGLGGALVGSAMHGYRNAK